MQVHRVVELAHAGERSLRQLGQPQPCADLQLVDADARLLQARQTALRILELDRRMAQVQAQPQVIAQRLLRRCVRRAR